MDCTNYDLDVCPLGHLLKPTSLTRQNLDHGSKLIQLLRFILDKIVVSPPTASSLCGSYAVHGTLEYLADGSMENINPPHYCRIFNGRSEQRKREGYLNLVHYLLSYWRVYMRKLETEMACQYTTSLFYVPEKTEGGKI